MAKTKIAYADYSINPLRAKGGGWACTKVSPGCQNCYSEKINNRFGNKQPYDNSPKEFELNLKCFDTLPKRKSARVFVQDMSDLFHPDVTDDMIFRVIDTARKIKRHTFLLLSKHADRMIDTLSSPPIFEMFCPNIWLGVTAENQEMFDERVPKLLQIPAALHWISIEPMLEEINFHFANDLHSNLNPDWVVVGCESSPNRRPCKLEWMVSAVEQCKKARVPVFVKQIDLNGKVEHDINKFPKELQIREYPDASNGQ